MPPYGYLFRVLHSAASQTVNNALAAMDLTASQGHIMGYLASCKEPPQPKDIEQVFHMSHPTISGLLFRLEKKEFIQLREDPNDRRCKRIYLLPKGIDCHEAMHSAIIGTEEKFVLGFSQEEKELFLQFLSRAALNVGCELKPEIIKEESQE